MAQPSTNDTWRPNSLQFINNRNENEIVGVEFTDSSPINLATNKKRIWVDESEGSLKYTVDGVNIVGLGVGAGDISVTQVGGDPFGIINAEFAFKIAIAKLGSRGGTVYAPPGTFKLILSSPIIVPPKVNIVGSWYGATKLDLSANTLDISAFVLSSSSSVSGFEMIGPGKTKMTAIEVNGSFSFIGFVDAHHFKTGWDATNENTYILTTYRSRFYQCGNCMDARLAEAGTTNSGEKFTFDDCVFADSDNIIQSSGSTLDMYIRGCSLDYSTNFGNLSNGQYYLVNNHLETDAARTPQGFLFNMSNGPQLKMNSCRIGQSGIPFVFGVTGTSGSISVAQSRCNFRPTGSGSDALVNSEDQIFLAGGATTATFHNPFASRITLSSVTMGYHTNNPARELTTPQVSMAASSTLGTITFGAPVPANTVLLLRNG